MISISGLDVALEALKDARASRMKDYLDLFVLVNLETLNADLLAQALTATFQRRGMAIPVELPVGLTDEFAHDPSRQVLWQAFIRKNELALDPLPAIVDRQIS